MGAVYVRLDQTLTRFVHPAMLEEAVQDGEQISFLALTEHGKLRKVCGRREQRPSKYNAYDASDIVA